MKKVIKQWLAFTLAIGALVSCGEDRHEPSSTVEGSGETVTLSLSAEVSVDDADLRAINYKLGTNTNGAVVPLPQFTNGQLVDVHTIVKSSTGATAAKTLKWRYDATSKKLVLSQSDGHDITVSGFNNDGGVKWYISGMIGGTLNGTEVTFEGKRELNGVDGNVGDIVGSLNVPYAFPWTEVIINTSSERNAQSSYKYAQLPTRSNVEFSPLGSLIAYKLGTNQRAGAYTFTPTGFTVSSNAFGDKGTFELNTSLPSNSTPTVLPAWTEGTPSALVYSFASGHEPGTIAHQETADKVYYAWVMPHATEPASVITRVMMKGDSSRPTTSTYRDYTKTWFTDYSVKGTQLNHGRIYSLKANATHTYLLPIEYVTDYNLAGGEGLTAITSNFTNPQPVGVTGPLRFANYNADGTKNDHGHRNDMSGYYSGYKVVGAHHATHNPEKKDLQAEVDATFGAKKYIIPQGSQLTAVWPDRLTLTWTASQNVNNKSENMAFGPAEALNMQVYLSDYSKGFSTDDNTQDAYMYAIRFKARNNLSPTTQRIYDIKTGKTISYTYQAATDNSLKCAYRYRRVGGATSWNSTSINLTNKLIVDVVYLGEEAIPTELSTISNNEWWEARQAEGLVISKTFPAAGYNAFSDMYLPGSSATYTSVSMRGATNTINFSTNNRILDNGGLHITRMFPIRLFYAEAIIQ